MSDYESKLEQFRRRAEELSRKKAIEERAGTEQKPSEPAAQVDSTAKAEPVSASIGPPLSQATGSVSQVDRSAVLASVKPPVSEPVKPKAASQPVIPTEPVPEVEDYLPWLKDEDEKQTKVETQKPAAPEASVQPASPSVSSPTVIPASSLSTPRTYVPPTSVPVRDQSLPFEGTGEPRPLIKPDKEDKQPEAKVEEAAAPESVQPAAQTLPGMTEAAEAVEEPVAQPKPATVPTRVVLKRPAAPAQSATPQEIADMWGRLPRHIQLLMGNPPKEVAQGSYKKFKETRDELIHRLLDPTISLEEAARILNVCPTTVRRYTNRGILPHYRTAGNQRRFRLSDILAFLETMSKERQSLEECEEVTA